MWREKKDYEKCEPFQEVYKQYYQIQMLKKKQKEQSKTEDRIPGERSQWNFLVASFGWKGRDVQVKETLMILYKGDKIMDSSV